MNIVNKLTLRHLWLNKNRTLITILGIMLSVAMICAVAGFVMSLRDMMIRTLVDSGSDYHIVYHGVSPETAAQIAAEPVFSQDYGKTENDGAWLTLYVRFAHPNRDFLQTASEIGERYKTQGMSANVSLLALEGVIAQDSVMMTVIWMAVIAIVIIVAGSVIVIANAFYISSAERVRQFGLLKSVGATKSQIAASILFEAFVLATVAIPLGIALGFAIQAGVLLITNDLLHELSDLNNREIRFRTVFSPVILYVSVAVSAVTLLISAWVPARRAALTSPIDAIRQTKDVRMRGGKLKTARLTKALFGFEGTLAAKSLKRSRGKYRATVMSLTASIVLFISVSSLIGAIYKSAEMEFGGMDFDVLIGVSGDWDTIERTHALLDTVPDANITRIQRMLFSTALHRDFFTDRSRARYESQFEKYDVMSDYLFLVSIPDEIYANYAPITTDYISGLLINTSGPVHEGGKSVEYIPYHFEAGMQLAMMDDNLVALDTITLSAQIKSIPDEIPPALFAGAAANILVPASVFKDIFQTYHMEKSPNVYSAFAVTTANPELFCKTAEDLLLTEENDIVIQDVAQMTRLNRNIVGIIRLFGYGFIAMLSLIAVTSVISTISTGMALRRQEFAMLFSAGMTPRGINKMLHLESFLYGFKSLAIGWPLGIGLSLLIHKAMSETFVFAYTPPIAAMLISAAAVMVLTFGTMRYSKTKMRKVSIVEALRSEII